MLELYIRPLSEIPIKKPEPEEQKSLIDIVEKILALGTTSNYDSKNPPGKQRKLEEKADQVVYKLYGLTTAEIEVVERTYKK